MARGINKVILIGNLGQDPDIRQLHAGGAVTNISLATSETWKDKQSGEQQERTEWHRVVFFNRLAEIAGEYLRKGSKVYIEGSLRTRKWQDKPAATDAVPEGASLRDRYATGYRYTTEIVASEMQMLDSHPSATNSKSSATTNSERGADRSTAAQPSAQGFFGKTFDFDENEPPF